MKNAWLVAGLVLVGCGVSQSEAIDSNDVTGEEGAELSATARSYVTYKPDLLRKCASPMCGGVFITDLNRANPSSRYVSALDFSTSGLDEETIAKALEGGASTILRGKLGPIEPLHNTRTFIVTDAWRGMPGVTPAAGDAFYRAAPVQLACVKASCPTMGATKLNAGGTTLFHKTNTAPAALSFVDVAWLTSRVEGRDAIVAGRFVNGAKVSGSHEQVLTASQVYVKLAEAPGPCPLAKMIPCAAGTVRSFVRSTDRCENPSVCVTPGVCAQFLPACPTDYSLQSWSGGAHACQLFACDPTFTL